jgi:hypothetical protein
MCADTRYLDRDNLYTLLFSKDSVAYIIIYMCLEGKSQPKTTKILEKHFLTIIGLEHEIQGDMLETR